MSAGAADFDDEVFGHGLPDAAATCIREAGSLRSADPAHALALLRALDPDDRVGAALLGTVMARRGLDEDDEEASASAEPAL